MVLRQTRRRALLPVLLLGAIVAWSSAVTTQQGDRIAQINGQPNINGVWQALNTANWNLEGQSAEAVPEHWQLGALFARPAGQSVVQGGTIPYQPQALQKRNQNRSNWPAADPETKCYRAGIPRSTYLPYPFEIIQGDGDLLFVYEYATSNRTVRMKNHVDPESVLVEQWLGWSNGRWEGDTLVVDVFGLTGQTWFDRSGNHHSGALKVTERYTPRGESHLWYEATMEDPATFSRPWTIAMPLYRRIEPNAEIFEYKCVEFAEPLLYGHLLKEPIK